MRTVILSGNKINMTSNKVRQNKLQFFMPLITGTL